MASQLAVVLLKRQLALKENAYFCLILDSLRQSSHYLVQEFVHNSLGNVIYLSYESISKPDYATEYLDCSLALLQQIQAFLKEKASTSALKTLVVVDSLNYIPDDQIVQFISSIVLPTTTIVGTYHTNVPQVAKSGYPGAQLLLLYIAQAIFEVEPVKIEDEEYVENKLAQFQFPISEKLNTPTFRLNLINRRKLGKSLTYNYIVDSEKHEYEVYKPQEETIDEEDEAVLKGLTTFNLTTNDKQKLAREQVELPYLEAQTEMGKMGGAIVYEFEKDDDYDEEDPYEDPF